MTFILSELCFVMAHVTSSTRDTGTARTESVKRNHTGNVSLRSAATDPLSLMTNPLSSALNPILRSDRLENQPEDGEIALSSSIEEVEGLRQTVEFHHHVL